MPLFAITLLAAQGPKLAIPKATWEPIFFESIDARAKMANLPSLRSAVLPHGDIEVRVWNGFGLTYLEGVVLRRRSERWSADWLPPTPPAKKAFGKPQPIGRPSGELVPLWTKLQTLGLLNLPDASELPDDGTHVLDGMSHVVEIQKDGLYRTYHYSNPSYHKTWPEAKRIIAIVDTLEADLKLTPMRTKHHEKLWGKKAP